MGGMGEEKEVYVYASYSRVCGMVKWVILRLYLYIYKCVFLNIQISIYI